MADWQRTLNLMPEWLGAKEGEVSIQALAKIVADRLAALEPFDDEDALNEERNELVEQLRDIAADETADATDFDDAMYGLYEWADTSLGGDAFNRKKVCWVKTF